MGTFTASVSGRRAPDDQLSALPLPFCFMQECCGGSSHQSNPDCFDAIYTEVACNKRREMSVVFCWKQCSVCQELCCAEADWDEEAALSKLGEPWHTSAASTAYS